MSFLIDLIDPPKNNPTKDDQYLFDNDVFENLQALQYSMNPSVLANADFSTGGVLITQADGDNAEFFTDWFVVGAALATYTLTPAPYPANSTIQSASPTFEHIQISGYNGLGGLYFYQRQPSTVRKYQKNFLTFGLIANNNQNKVVQVRTDIFSFYNPSSALLSSNVSYLQPGLNKLTSTINTASLSGVSVGASPYTEFRLTFLNLGDGTADINLYQLKSEFGRVSTLLNQN